MPENGLGIGRIYPKTIREYPKIVPGPFPKLSKKWKYSKTVRKQSQSDSKMIPKWSQNDPKNIQNNLKIIKKLKKTIPKPVQLGSLENVKSKFFVILRESWKTGAGKGGEAGA